MQGLALQLSYWKLEIYLIWTFKVLELVQEMRLVERKDKNNSVLVIGFAEFSDAHRANVALKALQVCQ